MTAIERTAYPTFARAPQPKELLTLYTPTPEDVAFVATTARGHSQKFARLLAEESRDTTSQASPAA